MSEMEELIARLEKAEGPSRELDAAISKIIGAERKTVYEKTYRADHRFTSSLDAALTLRIDGWYLRKLAEFSDGWYCTVVNGAQTFNMEQKPAPIAVAGAWLKARLALASTLPQNESKEADRET